MATHLEGDEVGALNPDFLAIGLGGTSMMAMLWTVAMGRRAVGVEMRGDPFLGVHWNLRVDLYHQLGLIDDMMLARFGQDRLPRRGDGRLFKLAECFYSIDTVAGDIVADEIIDGFDRDQHIVGTIHHVEFIDDRWRDGLPNRTLTLLQPPAPPSQPDPRSIRSDIVDVLDGPSTFQAGAASVLVLLRRYLERIEQIDLQQGHDPRVRLFTRHRVIPAEGDGFIDAGDGRLGIRIEALREFDHKGKFVRVRTPGTGPIDIGVPELFMIAEGFRSSDANRLGFRQHDVVIDHQDGRGPVVAQADFLAGLIETLVGGRLRRRIASQFDEEGQEFWVRQIAVGHEEDPEVGWVLVQVPDFMTFDPIEAGLVPEGTDPDSPEYFGIYQSMIYDYYMSQASEILELPRDELEKIEMVYGPKLFSLVERIGDDPQVAANGVIAGDGFGNGHFLTSGGAITGMVGHGARVLRYWEAREAGVEPASALRALAEGIKEDTEGWLHVSAKEYGEAVPINFGGERIAQIAAASGFSVDARAGAIDAAKRKRHSLLPLDPSDWRRLFLRNGAIRSAPLPELHAMHPALRTQRPAHQGAHVTVALVAPEFTSAAAHMVQAAVEQPGAGVWLVTGEDPADLPTRARDRLGGVLEVADCHDRELVEQALRGLMAERRKLDVLLGTADELQVLLGELRDALRIDGLGAAAAHRLSDQRALRDVLQQAGVPVVGEDTRAPDESVTCWMDVMSVGGVPAWMSATRSAGPRAAVLPREPDDPADTANRLMGLAALRALGTPSGLSRLTWRRYPDGTGAIADVAVRPPAAPFMALMGQAHGVDMYRAWANLAIRGLFAPIPRIFAAGVAFVPPIEADQWDELRARLADLLVETVPSVDEPYVVIRHRETAVVDDAVRRLLAAVPADAG